MLEAIEPRGRPSPPGVAVIVAGGPEQVHGGPLPCCDQFTAVFGQRGEQAALLVDHRLEAPVADDHPAIPIGDGPAPGRRRLQRNPPEHELPPGDLVSLLGPGSVFLEHQGGLEHVVGARLRPRNEPLGELDLDGFPGRHLPRRHRFAGDLAAVGLEREHELVPLIGRRVKQFVAVAEHAILEPELGGLVARLHLAALGVDGVVGIEDAVAAEVAVVGLVAEITPVGEEPVAAVGRPLAGLRLLPQPLIDPVPDAAADQPLVRLESLDVFVEVSGRVAHRVGVLADKDRPGGRRCPRRIEPAHGGIHVGVHVVVGRGVRKPLVLDRPGLVEGPERG